MIILLHGNNIEKSRIKLREIIASQVKKNTEATYYKIEPDTFNESEFDELVSSNALFQNAYIVVCDGILSAKLTSEKVIDRLKSMKDSVNVFIIVEEVLTKEILKKLEKVAEKIQESTNTKKEKNKKIIFNVFALTDALGNKDKKELWVLYQKAVQSGSDPEEIHRLFLWQTKAMLATYVSDANNSGLNHFVFKKAQGFTRNYLDKEVQKKSFELVALYHEARRGKVEFDIALEKFVLGL